MSPSIPVSLSLSPPPSFSYSLFVSCSLHFSLYSSCHLTFPSLFRSLTDSLVPGCGGHIMRTVFVLGLLWRSSCGGDFGVRWEGCHVDCRVRKTTASCRVTLHHGHTHTNTSKTSVSLACGMETTQTQAHSPFQIDLILSVSPVNLSVVKSVTRYVVSKTGHKCIGLTM